MSTPINILQPPETMAAFESWMNNSSPDAFDIGIEPLFDSEVSPVEEAYVNADREEELDWLTKRVAYVFQKIVDSRERYEMRNLIERNLNQVIRYQSRCYTNLTPTPKGYMPCQ